MQAWAQCELQSLNKVELAKSAALNFIILHRSMCLLCLFFGRENGMSKFLRNNIKIYKTTRHCSPEAHAIGELFRRSHFPPLREPGSAKLHYPFKPSHSQQAIVYTFHITDWPSPFKLLTEAAQSYLIILICPFTYLLTKKQTIVFRLPFSVRVTAHAPHPAYKLK
jgi:hypothetical protein